jgi:hypothetical protein
MKWTTLKILLLIVVLIGFILWMVLKTYWIYIPGLLFRYYNPISPNHPVEWTTIESTIITNRENKPNIVVILADDLGFNDISFYGGGIFNGKVHTPNIDSIGRDGVSFLNSYSGHATCAPARAALLTGRYASHVGFEFTPTHPIYVKILGTSPKALRPGVYHKELAESLTTENMTLPASEVTIAKLLQANDYHTMHIGKWHLGDTEPSRPTAHGFHESLGFNIISRYLPFNDPKSREFHLDDMLDKFLWVSVPTKYIHTALVAIILTFTSILILYIYMHIHPL